jgi:hypothetical protein
MKFERIVSDAFLEVLNGPLSMIVDFVREQPTPRMFDLRLGKNDRARLYYAGYGALSISSNRRGISLDVGKTHRDASGFNSLWRVRGSADSWESEMPAILAYLKDVPAYVTTSVRGALREGAVQG